MSIDETRLFRALDKALAAFKAEYETPAAMRDRDPGPRPPRIQRFRETYPHDSWKFDVLGIIQKIIGNDENQIFRSSEFDAYEKELRKRHPQHQNVKSGVAVTLQGLIEDKVIERVSRGNYRLR